MIPSRIVLLHGALGSIDQWQPFLPALSSIGEIDALEFSGHGSTPAASGPFRIERFAEGLAAHIERNDLAPANIFGYSMGGYVALHLARTHPALVRSIMTLATKFAWTSESAARETKMLDPDTIAAKVPAFAADLERRHTALGWRDVLARTAEMMQSLGETPALDDAGLAAIAQPVVIGIGDHDAMVSMEESVHAAKALANGTLQVFPNTQHPLERVDPVLLESAIAHWLRP